jgi:hypothetical protein
MKDDSNNTDAADNPMLPAVVARPTPACRVFHAFPLSSLAGQAYPITGSHAPLPTRRHQPRRHSAILGGFAPEARPKESA